MHISKEKHMELATNAFRPWVNGSKRKDIFVGDPEGRPYIVRASNDSIIPINVIIFAQSERDAIDRVHYALLESMKFEYRSAVDRRERLLNLFEIGTVTAEEFDTRYVCSIPWDPRGLI